MSTNLIFNLQTVFSLVLFGLISKWYIWPKFKQGNYLDALTYLLFYCAFRYLGTSFLVPNMSAGLNSAWANVAGKADLTVSIVALIGVLGLRYRQSWGVAVAWISAVIGSLDFIYNGPKLFPLEIPTHLGSLMWLTTVLGPTWMITLVLLFVVLIKKPGKQS